MKNKICKILLLTAVFMGALMATARVYKINAIELSPNSGILNSSSTETITILASPPGDAQAAQIRLDITGATITGYTPPNRHRMGNTRGCASGMQWRYFLY